MVMIWISTNTKNPKLEIMWESYFSVMSVYRRKTMARKEWFYWHFHKKNLCWKCFSLQSIQQQPLSLPPLIIMFSDYRKQHISWLVSTGNIISTRQIHALVEHALLWHQDSPKMHSLTTLKCLGAWGVG